MPTKEDNCPRCDGDGWLAESDPRDQSGETPMQMQCSVCNGAGIKPQDKRFPASCVHNYILAEDCPTCNSKGVRNNTEPQDSRSAEALDVKPITESKEPKWFHDLQLAHTRHCEYCEAPEPTQDNDKEAKHECFGDGREYEAFRIYDFIRRNDWNIVDVMVYIEGMYCPDQEQYKALEVITNKSVPEDTTAPMPVDSVQDNDEDNDEAPMPDLEAIDKIFWPHPFSGEGKPTQVAISGRSGKVFVLNWHTFNLAIQALISDRVIAELEKLQAKHIAECGARFQANERDDCIYDSLIINRIKALRGE